MTRGRRLVAGLTVLAAGMLPGAPGATAAPPLPGEPDSCRVIAFSPNVTEDRTAMCVGYVMDRTGAAGFATLSMLVYVTLDAGRTWLPAAGAGLVADDFTHLGGLAFSPTYATDRTIFLQTTTQGVMATSDLGATWRPLDERANDWADDMVVVPSLLPTDHELLGSASVVVASGEAVDRTSISQAFAHAPVPGSPGDDRRVLVPAGFPTDPAYVFADVKTGDGNSTRRRAALFQCDAGFSCDRPLHQWPLGTAAELAWLSPTFGRDRTMYVTVRSAAAKQPLQAWRSTDGGRTFARWTSVDKLLAVPNRTGGHTVALGLAMAAGTNRFYLRIVTDGWYPTLDRAHPMQVVYRSDDRGARWTRVAVSDIGAGSLRPTGNLPFYLRHGIDRRRVADLWMLRDGRVFATGGYAESTPGFEFMQRYFGLWCSTDGGGTWARRCAA